MADFRIQANRPELQQMFRQSEQIAPRVKQPDELRGLEQSTGEISFRESIRNFVHDVDNMQKDAAEKTQLFMAGEISNVHDVMIAVEKANTSFQLLMELRNKMLDAYQEIKRMSV
ncbi:MAG: flagellar hook-basal body complex protein FliE [Candidatus Glassbacteria bacterium]|nr:flagellar hook-basal body complex protein FliE [Candidatus Glassbacteria bacterium]